METIPLDLLDLAQQYTRLRRVAGTNRGEWAGPCPLPGCNCDRDGFRVQPYAPEGGRWYCRGCGNGRWHDAIDFIERLHGVGFVEAKRILDAKPLNTNEKLIHTETDRTKWEENAQRFAGDCTNSLFSDEGSTARDWLEKKRGIRPDTAKLWGLGFNPGDRFITPKSWGIPQLPGDKAIWLPKGITIPNRIDYLRGIKVRRPVPASADRKYVLLRGSQGWLYGTETLTGANVAILVESELDAVLLDQVARDARISVGVVAQPAGWLLRAAYAPYFKNIERLLVALDHDPAGQRAGDAIVNQLGPTAVKFNLPAGAKDPCDYWSQRGDLAEWINDGLRML